MPSLHIDIHLLPCTMHSAVAEAAAYKGDQACLLLCYACVIAIFCQADCQEQCCLRLACKELLSLRNAASTELDTLTDFLRCEAPLPDPHRSCMRGSPQAPLSLPPPLTSFDRSMKPPAASLPMPSRQESDAWGVMLRKGVPLWYFHHLKTRCFQHLWMQMCSCQSDKRSSMDADGHLRVKNHIMKAL